MPAAAELAGVRRLGRIVWIKTMYIRCSRARLAVVCEAFFPRAGLAFEIEAAEDRFRGPRLSWHRTTIPVRPAGSLSSTPRRSLLLRPSNSNAVGLNGADMPDEPQVRRASR